MLRVNVEIWPGGDESRKRQIYHIDVGNISQLADTSDYTYRIYDEEDRKIYESEVTRHERSHGALELIAKVLDNALERL